ncbi:MAG: homocitrate synthase family protein [Methanosphaera sp.]|uniref:homocitrate synthase family protein n=1 Tax=Methanosphaera sp. TaxID=2666342 RepID=UPI0025D13EB1|nr:homocitrate synthase family protein [Methanosphaera sp.]MCI5867193.1 homocitrate synthase family protein [Methanosphaera sp.]MDD6534739.1 homocitrate synthase family protein [Methanosphaera sp.]MDY3955593.1 homocitrate synthase family protein [Methanosphaera sp.]
MDRFVSIYNQEVEYDFPKKINIYDTTLRDGEQTPGVFFSVDEKLEIAHKLDELGVGQIEAGFPRVSENEKLAVKTIANEGLDAGIICLTRTKQEDIDAALDADVDGVITFMGLSDLHLEVKMNKPREEVNEICMNAVDYAKDHGLFVAFSAEDATRTELPKLIDIYKQAEEHKADRIHIADTTGSINPSAMRYLVRNIKKEINTEIALHCHNDFGMAVINCIAGLQEGASAISTTVNGIGERAGNTSLEELTMALKLLYNKDLGFKTEIIHELSTIVSKYSEIPIADNKPVVGNNIFRHESGIHVDAILKNPLAYEPYVPEMVGTKRQIVLGKHSGKAAVAEKLDTLNIKVDDAKLLETVDLVKKEREKGENITNEKFNEILQKANIDG